MRSLIVPLSFILIFIGCENLLPEGPLENSLLDGPQEGLSEEELSQFLAGDIAFSEVFSTQTGLGPFFVASSCASCHIGDGKGHPFTSLVRFGQSDATGNAFIGNGGPQLQNRAIPGHIPEVIPSGVPSSTFLPPAVTGLGFLAALSDAQILTNADPTDTDGDGISGVPNYVSPPDYFIEKSIHQANSGQYIGRFGKKAAAITLQIQTVNAYNQDMGITSDFEENEPSIYNRGFTSGDDVPDPEVSASTIRNVVFYLRTLKAPLRRDKNNPQVQSGDALFSGIGCGSCHIPSWTTPQTDVDVLSEKTFSPYTDLLLHNMGPELDDGYTEGAALTSEWKTPPLWGLGLSKDAQGGKYFLLHDGRATSLEEAILLHGGEAQNSRDQYAALSQEEKDDLLKFLESL